MSQAEPVLDEWQDDIPVFDGSGRFFTGGFSAESLAASIALHLVALLVVVLFAANRPDMGHEGVVVDISNVTLPPAPAASQAAATKSESSRAEPTSEPAPVAGDAVPIPVGEAAEKSVDPASAEPVAAAPESAPSAPATLPVPGFQEPTFEHDHGAYDPFEVYKAAVAEQVKLATASTADLTARVLFEGRVAVHLYLDRTGHHLQRPKVCLGHSEVYLAANMPQSMADKHFWVLVSQVVDSVFRAAPYPEAPLGVEIPKEMTYFIQLRPDPPVQPQG